MDIITRTSLQEVSNRLITSAKLLLDGGDPSGAYYLTGLSVECALKSCIAKQTVQHELMHLKRVQQYWNHELEGLIKAAGLETSLNARAKAEKEFGDNWLTVKDWKVDSRYETKSGAEAKGIYEAASDAKCGILEWIKRSW